MFCLSCYTSQQKLKRLLQDIDLSKLRHVFYNSIILLLLNGQQLIIVCNLKQTKYELQYLTQRPLPDVFEVKARAGAISVS